MLTVEVYGQFVRWPADFAFVMMKYFRKNGVPFVLHRKCIHTGKTTAILHTKHDAKGRVAQQEVRPSFGLQGN